MEKKAHRYAFSAVLKSMNKLLSETIRTETGYPLVVGTGMSLDALQEAESSILGKNPVKNTEPQESIYKRFEPLNSEAVKEYLLTFLELDLQEEQNESVSNAAVIEHLAKWLRGRPRWSASFVELYLVQKYNDEHDGTRGSFSDEGRLLIQALDRFIANYTNDKLEDIRDSGDRKESFDPPEGTAYSAVKDAFLMGEHRLVKNLEQAIFKFATSGKKMFIEQDVADLIEVGVAALSSGSKAIIDEPLIVQAGVNYISLDEAALENMIFQEGGLGEAFEKVVLPAIQRKFGSVLEKQVGSGGVSWEDYAVPLRSAYGVIGLACAEIEETLEWINNATGSILFEGQVPPFCFPDTNIGPDLMFLLWNKDYTEYIVVIAQAKYKKELKNQMDALRTITPSLLYFDKRGKAEQKLSAAVDVGSRKDLWEAAKPKLVGTKHGCVRFMVQYPCGQAGSATPGLLEDDEVSVGEKARTENKKSTTEERPAKKKKITDNKKPGFLTCISDINATDMFTKKGVEVLKALKGKD